MSYLSSRDLTFLTALLAGVLTARPAAAQKEPVFQKPTPDEEAAEGVEWDASAQGSLVSTTGNSRTTTASAGAKASRKQGLNKLMLEANGAYARSTTRRATDEDMSGFIDPAEVETIRDTTARGWEAKGRYDRFLTKLNALYALGFAASDRPSGKELLLGGQLGYSRLLLSIGTHEFTGEVAYDFTREEQVTGGANSIHSGRLFAGYAGKLREETTLAASVEILLNVNALDTARGEVAALQDRRTTGKLELSTELFDDISFSFSVSAKHDSAPALLPPLSLPYAPGFQPQADELDTTTKASLIFTFF